MQSMNAILVLLPFAIYFYPSVKNIFTNCNVERVNKRFDNNYL